MERERLLTDHLPDVRYIAQRIHDRLPVQVPLEDLVHAGIIGLIEAVDRFDPSKHTQLGYVREVQDSGRDPRQLACTSTGVRVVCENERARSRKQTGVYLANLAELPRKPRSPSELSMGLARISAFACRIKRPESGKSGLVSGR